MTTHLDLRLDLRLHSSAPSPGRPSAPFASKPPFASKQWCELHKGRCQTVVPLLRCIVAPSAARRELLLVCPKCARDLRKAGLTRSAKWAGVPCEEVVAPHRPPGPREPYEVLLTPDQVRYLRALGFKVI